MTPFESVDAAVTVEVDPYDHSEVVEVLWRGALQPGRVVDRGERALPVDESVEDAAGVGIAPAITPRSLIPPTNVLNIGALGSLIVVNLPPQSTKETLFPLRSR